MLCSMPNRLSSADRSPQTRPRVYAIAVASLPALAAVERRWSPAWDVKRAEAFDLDTAIYEQTLARKGLIITNVN